jgi:hypothetical protein
MSSPLVQQQRKAQAINDAVEAVRAVKPDAERLDMTLGEPMLADEDRIVAIVAELAELVGRQERAIDKLEKPEKARTRKK